MKKIPLPLCSLSLIMSVERIPPRMRAEFLPSPALSVMQFLQFPLPIQLPESHSTLSGTAQLSFGSQENPNVELSLEVLKDLPIPPACLISTLEASQSSWTWKSMCYAHLPANQSRGAFPLWILKYWDEVSKLRKHIKLPWSRAEMFLVEIQNSSWRSPGARQLCDSVWLAFFQVPWCGGTSGFTSSEPTVKLAAYLSKNWLETVHIDQQLDLLRIDLARTGSTQYQLLNPRVFEKLIIVYQHRERQAYHDASGMRHLWAIGCEIAEGIRTKLGGVANVIRHWVGVIVDIPNSKILYGDSLGGSHAPLKAAIEWWVRFHTQKTYTHKNLPITQQLDSYNCPILAVNVVHHHLLPQ